MTTQNAKLLTFALSFCTFIFAFCTDLFRAMTASFCHCEERDSSLTLRNRLRNLGGGNEIATPRLVGARNDRLECHFERSEESNSAQIHLASQNDITGCSLMTFVI
jgi:hypothetical protein